MKSIILDLRTTPDGDFDMAGQVLERFAPKGQKSFHREKAGREKTSSTSHPEPTPPVHAIVIVLVDGDTSGAGEVIAGALRIYANAMIVGSKTAGQAVELFRHPALRRKKSSAPWRYRKLSST